MTMTVNMETRKKYFDDLGTDRPITFLDSGMWSMTQHLVWNITRLCYDGNNTVAFGYHGIRSNDTDQYVIIPVEDCVWCNMDELIDARRNSLRRVIYHRYLIDDVSESKFLELNQQIKNMKPEELGFT
jgi:hypothetical protein